ncbi:hypothetical protein TPHA_0C00440 [Tetrapisispora phaffii CBS 4417]|uniref:Uncharacterized protein n=1 Tax=Tetrapisispora phaffii (strain ATCC 24235 / CBS 4417 / NBRC 1672 / NRRL Y-8282 / UCD 70-5) TaxID=1071381 RepID=G8BR25_TETPH|nr:hypothetical protein TPHA_0C00440 [Tetrapisispora phaffii CBS 4417]CCE62201.1 hypothetical protein TPHA_0C00440 [Tetrapisispora phaffii CBS 4417]
MRDQKSDETYKGSVVENQQTQKKGLKTEINPILFSSNLNLIRRQHKQENPYLNFHDAKGEANYKKVNDRLHRGLVFHKKGEITAEYEKQRLLNKKKKRKRIYGEKTQEKLEKEKLNKIKEGLIPNHVIGEDKYFTAVEDIPDVEWWDRPYLDENNNILEKYDKQFTVDDVSESESEVEDDERNSEIVSHPSIRYVQHPVPIKLGDRNRLVSKIYLTKTERKKLRRNRKKLEREEKETKIKLGILPKPEPKVKVSNMMNVYENNQNITDPTQWENTVREQVEERKRKHEETNKIRHEEAVKRKRENLGIPNVKVPPRNNICKIFKFKKLVNPSIRYKLKVNSKQLGLRGACARVKDDGPGIIIIYGDEKSCKFYEKLITSRLKWNESFIDKTTNSEIDMSDNSVEKVWEGYINESKFPNWFMKVYQREEDIKDALERFNAGQLFQYVIE